MQVNVDKDLPQTTQPRKSSIKIVQVNRGKDSNMRDREKAEKIVYISCSDEVRYSFVSHLSEALRSISIIKDVFEDSNDLFSGEAQAMVERARVSVVVLSGNRESSAAYLDKLLKVLECRRKEDQVVIPVLYGVGTSEAVWGVALQNMSGLSPFHKSRKGCSDSKLVKEIVRDVYEKLCYMEQIGIYSKMVEIESMVCKQPLGIRCVGIWGMPGIGKTTLAKAVFNQLSGEFDSYCFIKDYDSVFHEKGLYRLLEEHFLEEKSGAGRTITKLSLLRKKLNNKRVLVVLDDVRDPLVAESFLGGVDWFGPKSLIIITSREKKVFRLCRVNQIYEVQGLNEKEALQLFMMCASLKDMKEKNLHKLSMEVIRYANGNPLALRIYGKKLKGKTELSEMQNTYIKLKQRPPSEIVDVVKSSYETLTDGEKNIFLDIACFFRGENVDYIMQLLEGCDFFPHVGVDVLVDKGLVTISENILQMHNLIQDVGREIVKRETIRIERRSRLWEPWSIKYLIEDNEHKTTFTRAQGTEDIEGMFLDTSSLGFDVKPAAFENMFNLRLLKIYSSNSEIHPIFNFPKGFLCSLPNELRLLHWENYPLQCLPQNFDPMHLVEINMPYSQLQKLWGETKNLEMLKTIRLCHSQELVDIEDLLKAQNLEVIDLQGCTRLQSFRATGQLLHLRIVNLSGCTEIKVFPEVPPTIEKLHLQGTGITELPVSAVQPNYRELLNLLKDIPGISDFSNQNDLERLMKMSSSGQNLGKLICLDLKDCSRLQSLPNMVNLECVKVLDLSGCSEVETIQGLPQNLKELYLAGTAVREVPQLPRSLELLDAHGCVSLKSIPLDSENLPMHYTFSNCFNISPQVVNDFLVKVLGSVKAIPRELPQELNEAPAFSFCAPSHVNQESTLDLQLGSSVMTRLNPSWRSTLVGFAMLVEIAFPEDYYDDNGFDISCVCRWKNEEGHSHKIERNLHCWAPRKVVPNIQKDHMFVFCDVSMRPSTDEGNDPNIFADLVVFEFFPVNKQKKRLGDTCTVTRCGVYVITALTGNTSLEDISPVLSSDPRGFSGNESEEALRVCYDGLEERSKALFLYMACLFNDEDVNLAAPLFSSIDVDVSSGVKELAKKSLIRVSSNGEIVMHSLLCQIGKEILRSQSILPGSSKQLRKDFEKNSLGREEEITIVNNSAGSSSSRNWKYDVYPCFRVEDVPRGGVNRLLVALKHKSVITFGDDQIGSGKLISPLRVQAIRESRISIVVLSKRFASSSWLLNELVEILKCREELGQEVMTIFYDVDPSDVKKQTGEFGRHFKQTYKGKTKDEERQCRQALSNIASIAGYLTLNWDNEAQMFEEILTDISNKLNRTLYGLVGIKAHIAKMNSLLQLKSKKVKIIGIWGHSGIGKSAIARYLYNQIYSKFQGSAFVDFFKGSHEDEYSDNYRDPYSAKLHYQKLVLSEITNEPDITIEDLGAMKERVRDQKVLIILDSVDDRLVLDAVAGLSNLFGPGSRIIVITKDLRILNSHGVNHIYKVDLPSKKEALQILCQVAFGKNSPPDGFMQLATEVVESVGNLPLGLRVSGSYFRGLSEQEWSEKLPRLRYRLDGEIESILRFGYDGLCEEDRDLFLYISCLFNPSTVEYLTRLLTSYFVCIKARLRVLAEKSIIHMSEHGYITMHHLQEKLGREIVRKQFLHEPGKRKFLVYYRDISQVLAENTGTRSVEGISLDMSEIKELLISEKGFNEMTNLKFLKFYSNLVDKQVKVHIPHGLDFLSHQLILLHWEGFPMRCMPSNFIPIYLVELTMVASKLEKLWNGIQPLESLKSMNLRGSLELREIPDLTQAANLETLDLGCCSSLTELPSSIRNLHKLTELNMERCRNLEALPTDINLASLHCLNLNGCSRLRSFPQISRSISDLYLDGTAIEEVPGWIENMHSLATLSMTSCNKLKRISPNISKLKLLVEVDFSECKTLTEESWQNHPEEICTSLTSVNMSGNSFERLPDTWTSIQPKDLDISRCRNLVSLPELPASLSTLTANYCESLESLYGSFQQPQMALQFINCFKLNHQAREYILHSDLAYAILPGEELPSYFTHRVDGNFLKVSLSGITPSRKISSFRACIVVESRLCWFDFGVNWLFRGETDTKYFSLSTNIHTNANHLIVFNFEFSSDGFCGHPAELNNGDMEFDFFCLDHNKEMVKIKECGIQQQLWKDYPYVYYNHGYALNYPYVCFNQHSPGENPGGACCIM